MRQLHVYHVLIAFKENMNKVNLYRTYLLSYFCHTVCSVFDVADAISNIIHVGMGRMIITILNIS